MAEDGGVGVAIARQPSPVYYNPPVNYNNYDSSNSELFGILVVLYIIAALWTLFITALIGSVINDATDGTPSSVNYCMFVAVVSWIVLIIGLVSCGSETSVAVLDGFAVFFTLIAAVVLSAKLGVHSCFNYVSPTLHNWS